jgi:hypothetical protein
VKQVIIAGSPKCGKTTLANALGERLGIRHEQVAHSDDLVGVLDWSSASLEVARWIDDKDPLSAQIVEGVALGRATRKWALDRPETERPCVVFVHLTQPFGPLTDGQARMAKGCETVFREIRGDLSLRRVSIVEPNAGEIRNRLAAFVEHIRTLLQVVS